VQSFYDSKDQGGSTGGFYCISYYPTDTICHNQFVQDIANEKILILNYTNMTIKEKVLSSINPEQELALVKHFNSIYDCNKLSEHEYRMIYLAWMWNSGIVYRLDNWFHTFEQNEAGVPLNDYEVTIEDEMTGGVNLDLMYSFYDIDGIHQIMGW
jgi:hypothetical protein